VLPQQGGRDKCKVLSPDLESVYGSLARAARVILGLYGSVSEVATKVAGLLVVFAAVRWDVVEMACLYHCLGYDSAKLLDLGSDIS
jgi:hypothetical protein